MPITNVVCAQWTDFTYANLVNGWDHILSIQGATGKFQEELTDSQKEIIDEHKIDLVAELWNVGCLRDPLKKGAAHVRGKTEPDITIKNGYIQLLPLNPGKSKKNMEPDMAIFYRNGDRMSSTTLVMGDNKCETKWDHRSVADPAVRKQDAIWPLRQILTYCIQAKTRYGWIMTTSEVVVFRMSNNPSTTTKSEHFLEWAFVPWSNSGEGKLTVNLAIWWLGMMSLADKHRAIVLPNKVLPINTWTKTKAKDGTVIYVHHLSRRVLKQPPSGQVHLIDNA